MTLLLAPSTPRWFLALALTGALGLSAALVGCDSDEGIPFDGFCEGTVAEVIACTDALDDFEQSLEAADLINRDGELADSMGMPDVALEGDGPFTVFAPVDQGARTYFTRSALLRRDESSPLLRDVLSYHVVPNSALTAAELSDGQTLTTLDGAELRISERDGDLYVNDARITRPDVDATNGVVHFIDGVLLENLTLEERITVEPALVGLQPALAAAGLFDFEADVDSTAGTLESGGPYTLFLPFTNVVAAYTFSEEQLNRVLPYHAIQGTRRADELAGTVPDNSTVGAALTTLAPDPTEKGDFLQAEIRSDGEGNLLVNRAPIVDTDLVTADGVIHVLGDVLTKPLTVAEQVEIRPSLALLETNLRSAGLFVTLNDLDVNEGQGVTLFAPNDGAFAGLPQSAAGALSDDRALADKLLSYHVATGIYCADSADYLGDCTVLSAGSAGEDGVPGTDDDVAGTEGVPTLLDGEDLTFGGIELSTGAIALVADPYVINDTEESDGGDPDPDGDNEFVGVRLVATDIEAVNGLVHVLSGVLTRPLDLIDIVKLNGLEELAEDLEANPDVIFTGDGPYTLFGPTDDALSSVSLGPDRIRDHIVEGRYCLDPATFRYPCAPLAEQETLTALSGATLDVGEDKTGDLTVEDVAIADADNAAANGVLHVIPEVLEPADGE